MLHWGAGLELRTYMQAQLQSAKQHLTNAQKKIAELPRCPTTWDTDHRQTVEAALKSIANAVADVVEVVDAIGTHLVI